MHKNYKLLILLVGLMAMSSLLSLTSNRKSSANFRVDLFAVSDTAGLQSVKIKSDQEVKISRSGPAKWMVNEKYEINTNLKNVLLALLNQVTVRRPVSNIQKEEIAASLLSGLKVTLQFSTGPETFYAGGNPARTQSYFMKEGTDQPYIVEIPGYRNYLSGIFDLTELQWRDRTLFNTHWRSLQSLAVSYPGNERNNLRVFFEEQFFKIEGVARMDTTGLMAYLQAYELFEANEFIPEGFSARYDSLKNVSPIAIIELNDINSDRNQRLEIYPKLENDNYVLTRNKKGELSLTEFARIRSLLSRPGDFKRN